MPGASSTIDPAPPSYEGVVMAGKFRLERVLGEGGMGIVYAAVHLDLLKHVAIKIIRSELVSREDVVERVMEEARIAAHLRSEHVAHVLDVGRLDTGAPFIVMEYLDGSDLGSELTESGRRPVQLAVSYVLQTCEAVAEAHSVGIIHRDLKPENLFVASRADGEPIVKVLDFGISKNLSTDRRTVITNPTMIVGSPDYMSPEAMRSKGTIGPASDIWSLGAVLYELLTARRPFEADSVPEICARVLAEEPAPLRSLAPEISPEVEAIVHRCLRKEPEERFESVAALALALAPHGPAGSTDLAERAARIASGVRIRPRKITPSTPRPRLASIPIVRDSTSPLAVTPASATLPTFEAPRRKRHAALLASVALVSVAGIGVGAVRLRDRFSGVNVDIAAATATAPPNLERAAVPKNTSPTIADEKPPGTTAAPALAVSPESRVDEKPTPRSSPRRGEGAGAKRATSKSTSSAPAAESAPASSIASASTDAPAVAEPPAIDEPYPPTADPPAVADPPAAAADPPQALDPNGFGGRR